MMKTKSRAAAYIFFLVAPLLISSDKPKLVKTKVNNEITVFVPVGWMPMQDVDFVQRYPSVRAPLAAFTNIDREIDFMITTSATQWPDGNLEMSQRFFKASLLNMFDRVEMISEGIHEVNKKRFIYFEFESRVNGNRQDLNLKDPVLRYTYIQYLVEPSRTLVFSFNCPKRLREDWQETAKDMMQRISVKTAAKTTKK